MHGMQRARGGDMAPPLLTRHGLLHQAWSLAPSSTVPRGPPAPQPSAAILHCCQLSRSPHLPPTLTGASLPCRPPRPAPQVLAVHPDQFRLTYALSREGPKNKRGGKMYIQDRVRHGRFFLAWVRLCVF